MSILGNRVLRIEDPKLLTSGGSYVSDLSLEGAARVTFVRSTMAHARLVAVEVEEARRAPGVVGVFRASDLGLGPMPPVLPMINQAMGRPPLADGVVRFVGEPVAAVVTETPEQGEDAAEAVVVDYDPLPALVDPEAALASEVVLHEAAGTNVATELPSSADDSFFDGCEVVVSRRIVNQRLAPCPLEVRGAASRWGPDGRLTHWTSTQAPHSVRDSLAGLLGVEPASVRVVTPDVGGGFGAKMGVYPEDLVVAQLARLLGRPLVWVETRSESMLALGHGRAQVQYASLGGRRDGRLIAYRLHVVQDAGAYPAMGSILPFITSTMTTGVYDIERVDFASRSVVTNTTPVVAYRGAGRPEATAALERMVDIYAAEVGMDPAELRRRNLVPPERFPYTSAAGSVYDNGDYERALDLALESAGYRELRAEQARRRAEGSARQLGVGISTYVEVTNPVGGSEFASVEVSEDESVVVRTGTSPHGQGHDTAWAMLASEATGIPVEQIEVVHGDTDAVRFGQGTMGSRSAQMGGVAVAQAADKLVAEARQVAAGLLEASVDDVVLDRASGRFHVAGAPAVSRSWAEVARQAGGLAAEVDFQSPGPTYPFGAHVAVVEVDLETGAVRLVRMVAVDDAGRVLNPLLVEGQVHGGLAQGAAQALLEQFVYDEEGNPLTANLADYAFVSAAELPSFDSVRMQTPTPLNPLGAKGIGESATIGSTPAVHNAVVDALSHLGVRHLDMPATPRRVWEAIRQAAPRP
jgi:carbon-monoxide dehydrogenase large subunit